jgi:hypothetical protein
LLWIPKTNLRRALSGPAANKAAAKRGSPSRRVVDVGGGKARNCRLSRLFGPVNVTKMQHCVLKASAYLEISMD